MEHTDAGHGGAAGKPGRTLLRPLQAFIHLEIAGGIALLVATVVALLWANSPWDGAYNDLWHRELDFDTSLFKIEESLAHLVNDGLMAIFFFVVGLEIKRELVHGQLASPRRALLPVAAAFGGMIVPALIYAAFNFGSDGAKGWGIPMATDIAFAVGALAMLGKRIPLGLKVFLLALAIVDDLGAIVVIAVFYSEGLSVEGFLWAGALIALIFAVQKMGVEAPSIYIFLGALLWVAVLKSGIHATIAGVVLAMMTPASPLHSPADAEVQIEALTARLKLARENGEETEVLLREIERVSRNAEAPLDRLVSALHPWASFVIIPIFAIANAGLLITGASLSAAASSPVSYGVGVGLVVGKTIGITLATWLVVRFGLSQLPVGVNWKQIGGAAMLGGIGFTVSLFVTSLAFEAHPVLEDDAKMGILIASTIAGVLGYLWLRVVCRGPLLPSETDQAPI